MYATIFHILFAGRHFWSQNYVSKWFSKTTTHTHFCLRNVAPK